MVSNWTPRLTRDLHFMIIVLFSIQWSTGRSIIGRLASSEAIEANFDPVMFFEMLNKYNVDVRHYIMRRHD